MEVPNWTKRFNDNDGDFSDPQEPGPSYCFREGAQDRPRNGSDHGCSSYSIQSSAGPGERRTSAPAYLPRTEEYGQPQRDASWSYLMDSSQQLPLVHTSASFADFEHAVSSTSGSGFAPRTRNTHSAPSSTLGRHERRKRRPRKDNSSDETYTSGYSTNTVSELSEFHTLGHPRPPRKYKAYSGESKLREGYGHDDRGLRGRDSRDQFRREPKANDIRLGKRSESNTSMNSSEVSKVSKDRSKKSADSSKGSNVKKGTAYNSTTPNKHVDTPTIGNVAIAVTNNFQYDPNDPFAFIQTSDVPFNVKARKCLGPILGVLLLLILAAALGAAIYFASALKETQEKQIELLQANLAVKIHRADYMQNLDELSKNDFEFLSSLYCRQMDLFYRQSKFRDTYRGCQVTFMQSRFINFTLFFLENGATSSDIVSVIRKSAPRDTSTTETLAVVDKFHVDLDSVKVSIEKTLEPEGFNRILVTTTARPPPPAPQTTAESSPQSRHDPSTGGTSGPQSTVDKGGTAVSSNAVSSTAAAAAAAAVTTKAPVTRRVIVEKKIPPPDTPIYSWDPCREYVGTYFPHPVECDVFFQCNHDLTVKQYCSTGLIYNWKTSKCVSRFTPYVPCPDPDKAPPKPPPTEATPPTTTTPPTKTTPPPTPSTTPPSPSPTPRSRAAIRKVPANTGATLSPPSSTATDKSTNSVTINGTEVPLTAIAGKYEGRTKPPDKPCTDDADGKLYAHPDDCGMFIQCVHGQTKSMKCPPSLVFDPKSNACVVVKTLELICPDITPCKDLDDGYFPHPINCHKYIQCKFHEEAIETCPDELVWNDIVKSCMHNTQAIECLVPNR